MKLIIQAQCRSKNGVIYPSANPQEIDDRDAVQLINAGRAVAVNPQEYYQALQPHKHVNIPDYAFSCVITCHEKYFKYLPECLDSVRRQSGTFEIILALDNCGVPENIDLSGVVVVKGVWGNPNPARNAAIKVARYDWMISIDADNWLSAGYLQSIRETLASAPVSTAAVYADLRYYRNGKELHSLITPDSFDYWELRKRNYISACSAFYIPALMEAGGWQSTKCYDDWAIALEMSRNGWTFIKNKKGVIPVRHEGEPHRGDNFSGRFEMAWNCKTYAIVTLLAGKKEPFKLWLNWLLKADLPPKTELFIVDNSRDVNFSAMLMDALIQLQQTGRFHRLSYQRDDRALPDHKHAVCTHVASLYNAVLPHVNADSIVTLEDDTIPPLNGLRRLVNSTPPISNIGAMAGAYLSRHGTGVLTAAYAKDFFIDRVRAKDLTGDVMSVHCLAMGFTLWNNAFLKACLPFRFQKNPPKGFDTLLSNQMEDIGALLRLESSVWCEHLFNLKEKKEEKNENADQNDKKRDDVAGTEK